MDQQTELYMEYMRARIDATRDPARLSPARLHAAFKALDASFLEWCVLIGAIPQEPEAEHKTDGVADFDTLAVGLHAIQRQAEVNGEVSPIRVEFDKPAPAARPDKPTPLNEVIAHAKKQVVPLKEATA